MCTKSRAVALGCKVSGSYSDNQLVKYSDLSVQSEKVNFLLETELFWAKATGSYTCNGSNYQVSIDSDNIQYSKSFDKINSFNLGLMFYGSYKNSSLDKLKVGNTNITDRGNHYYIITVTDVL